MLKKEGSFESGLIKKYTITQILMFFTILTSNMGEIINIRGVKLSWVFTFATVIWFFLEGIIHSKPIMLKNNKIQFAFLFFIVWLLYATIQLPFTGLDKNAVNFYIILIVNIFLILMIILTANNVKTLLFYNKALIVSLLIALTISVWEMATGNHLVDLPEKTLVVNKGRAFGVFGNVNDLAAFICLGMVSVLIELFLHKKHKLFYIIILLISSYIVYNQGARASLYALILLAGGVLAGRAFYSLYKKRNDLFRILLFSALTVLVCAAIYVIFVVYPPKRILHRVISPNTIYTSDLYRIQLSYNAVVLFIKSYFLGVGPGQSITLLGINVHNMLLEILAEYGLIVLGVIALIINIFNGYKEKLPPWISSLFMAFVPFFALISVQSSGTNRLRIVWSLLTIMFLLVNIYKTEQIEKQKPEQVKKRRILPDKNGLNT